VEVEEGASISSEKSKGGSLGNGKKAEVGRAALESRPKEKSGFQEELGLFKNWRLEQYALVLLQGWSSWTFGLTGLGFESVSNIAAFPSLSSREEFHATDGILSVQAEREYLEAAHHKLEEFENIQVVYACSDPSFWSADGARVLWMENGPSTLKGFICRSLNLLP